MGDSHWRVSNVEKEADLTRVTIEIKNEGSIGSLWMAAFDAHPLVLTDNFGHYYESENVGPLPEGVLPSNSDPQGLMNSVWTYHSGQSFNIAVEFPPLQSGATRGTIKYRDDVHWYNITSIKFSLRYAATTPHFNSHLTSRPLGNSRLISPFVQMGDSHWRVSDVERESDLTRVTIEIKNEGTTGSLWMAAFDAHPLVLIDNLGHYYESENVGPLPEGVLPSNSDPQGVMNSVWTYHSGQSFHIAVEFPPLQPGATGGKIDYKDYFHWYRYTSIKFLLRS
jgi:hypothetical protein